MIAIMQPYFLPFIGYFQLIDAVDTFVLYDDAQFTKKGYMTSNKLCLEGQEQAFSLNVQEKKKIDIIRNKHVADEEFAKSCRRVKAKLSKLPYFDEALFDQLTAVKNNNLFDTLFLQIEVACARLEIDTRLVRSSDLIDTQHLVGQEKIVALCQAAGDTSYVNSSGGQSLYSKENMATDGITLHWLTYTPTVGEISAPHSILQSLFEHPLPALQALARHHVLT